MGISTFSEAAKRSSARAAVERLRLFEWDYDGGPRQAASLYIVVPQWIVLAILGPLPAVRLARWRRRRLARRRGFDVEPMTPVK